MAMMREKSRKLTLFFCLIWALSVLYGEMFAYWVPFIWSYSWPHLHSSSVGGDSQKDFVKVAVLTDPQLMDRTSHDFGPKSLLLEIASFYSDLYMRRAFISTISPFKPDAILFLGDYFDGGPQLSNKEWQESLSRFKHIFDMGERGKTKDIPVHYIPGNHDIGYAGHHFHKPEVLERYEGTFGERNYKFTIGKVDFVAVDSQTLDGNVEDDTTSSTWFFVDGISRFSTGEAINPRVLLTHIPLYRPDWTPCGPYRSSEVINQRISRSAYDQRILYQNYVTEESAKRLLDSIQPVLVLSGHDHDQCTVNHKAKYGTVKEHTLGTISWQQGNLYPSFMLLSVGNFTHANGSSEPVILSQLCFLPQQLFIYIWYIILFVVTILSLSTMPTYDIQLPFGHLMTSITRVVRGGLFSRGRKEKNEDENCEYEMMWDAEGGMHLIKKPCNAPLVVSKETSSLERGNAVIRAVRKQTVQDLEDASKVDIDETVSNVKNLPRSNKSLMRIMLQRCIRVLGMVLVIAVVNVPLYMMLLFKDWVEQ